MKKNLIKIVDAKNTITKSRGKLKEYFLDQYPNIFFSIKGLEREIVEQLRTLMCSSLKYKTTRIELNDYRKGNDNPWNRGTFILSRTQCFTHKNTSNLFEIFSFGSQNYIVNKNKDFIWKSNLQYYGEYKNKLALNSSILVNHPLVDQEKLKLFFKLRYDAIKIQKKISYKNSETAYPFSSLIRRYSIGENIDIIFEDSNIIFNILDNRYANRNLDDIEDLENKYLYDLNKYWDKINDYFLKVNDIKRIAIKDCNKIIKDLKKINQPYLVFQSLQKNG
jgi:hypothetical protein